MDQKPGAERLNDLFQVTQPVSVKAETRTLITLRPGLSDFTMSPHMPRLSQTVRWEQRSCLLIPRQLYLRSNKILFLFSKEHWPLPQILSANDNDNNKKELNSLQ